METKYKVGHRFFEPRSFNLPRDHEVVVDGLTYTRRDYRHVPVVRDRTITMIDIRVTAKGTEIKYKADDTADVVSGTAGWLKKHYTEDQLDHAYATEAEALEVAQQHAMDGKEYYGHQAQ